METVVLGLGSNKGDSWTTLCGTLCALGNILKNMRVSSVYKTKPQEYLEQDDFFNMVVMGAYAGRPEELLTLIHHIEKHYGRNRAVEIPKGPRCLDIDIIFFGQHVLHLDEPPLDIPHPALEKRRFVLMPLLELVPDYRHPADGRSLQQICDSLPEQGVVKTDLPHICYGTAGIFGGAGWM